MHRTWLTTLCALVAIASGAIVGCATTSKTWIQLPPLPDSATVTIFDREPNVKFDRVCEFEIANRYSSSTPTAITQVLKSEARKCGADGVIIYSSLLSASTSESTWATAIKIRGREAIFVSPESVKAFSLAIQNHDLSKVKELLSSVPKHQKDRAPSDDTLIDLGLYITTLDGLACNAKMVGLLEVEYEGKFSNFGAVKLKGAKSDSQTPLCLDVVARSLAKMKNSSSAVLIVNNYYVDLLANYDGRDLEQRVSAYNQLLVQASRMIVEACAKSAADSTCILKASFLDFASKTKDIKSRALKRNAKDILKILSPEAREKKES